MPITRLGITTDIFGGAMMAEADKPRYKYEGDKRTDILEGFNIPIVLPKLKFEKVNVFIPDPNRAPLVPSDVEPDGALVVFENLKAEVYRPQNGYGLAIAATADSVRFATASDAPASVKKENGDAKKQ